MTKQGIPCTMAIKVEITPAKYGLTSREEADIASVCDKYDQTSFVFVALFVISLH
jgi:hypothetical protein